MEEQHNYPKLHNAMWPGLVGKGSGSEPSIDLDTMLDLTANAQVNGQRFDGVDLSLSHPHTPITADNSEIHVLAEKVQSRGLTVGSCVAPVWAATGGGSSMGSEVERKAFLHAVKHACRIASQLSELGVREHGVIRIDSSCSPADWAEDPAGNTRKIADTFRIACDIASDYGERLAAEGEVCWGGMHSWKAMLDTLEATNRPGITGFQADMAHTLLYTVGVNSPEDRTIAEHQSLDEKDALDSAIRTLAEALRPWTIDDASMFLARFSNGSLGNFEATRYARGHKAQYTLELNGEHASLRWDLHDLHRLQIFDHKDESRCRGWRSVHVSNEEHPYMDRWWVPGLQIGYEHTFIHQFADFMDDISTDHPAMPTFADAFATDRVTDAVLDSAQTRQWKSIAN